MVLLDALRQHVWINKEEPLIHGLGLGPSPMAALLLQLMLKGLS